MFAYPFEYITYYEWEREREREREILSTYVNEKERTIQEEEVYKLKKEMEMEEIVKVPFLQYYSVKLGRSLLFSRNCNETNSSETLDHLGGSLNFAFENLLEMDLVI